MASCLITHCFELTLLKEQADLSHSYTAIIVDQVTCGGLALHCHNNLGSSRVLAVRGHLLSAWLASACTVLREWKQTGFLSRSCNQVLVP